MRTWIFRFLVSLIALLPATAWSQAATGLDGDWDGTLGAGPALKFRLSLHVESGDKGATAVLTSVDQGGVKIPVAAISRDANTVAFEVPAIHGGFKGQLSADGQTLAGIWTQGAAFPLSFTRRPPGAPAPAAQRRPQEPKPPFPYESEDVSFPGPDGIRLAGTLTRPQSAGPFAAVVLISGSGRNDRDEAILGHKLFLVLADRLTRDGIAVLRFDKRGVGKSTGDYDKATSRDFAADVEAAVAYLRTQSAIDAKKIGLIGHSEGGTIAPMVAAKDHGLAFIVLMAGTSEKGEELLLQQERLIAQAAGAKPAALDKAEALSRRLYDAIAGAADDEQASSRAVSMLIAQGMAADKAAATAAPLTAPWFRFFLNYNPQGALAQVTCPVLAINGALDLQVPPKPNLAGIKTALAHDPDVTVAELPGLNHLFQTAQTGAPSEYGDIEETIAPSVLTMISDWISKHTNPG